MEELIDIYDRDRNRTGLVVPREGAFLKDGQYMLYVLGIVEDLQGRILITQRSQEKHWAAGWWEVSGGGVSAGETSEQAIVRELAEEVGLDVADYPLERIYTYENVDPERGDNYIVDIYRFQLDVAEADVTLADGEAVACKLATRAEIDVLNDRGIFLHYNRIQQALESIAR